jgi:hypothetical protein
VNDRARSDTASGWGGFEVLCALVAVVVVGPFALLLGALGAALWECRRRLWLWALAAPSVAAGLLLWPLMKAQLLAAAAAAHAAHSHGDPRRLLAALWPQLWPAWLAALTLAPLVALVLVYHQQGSRLDPNGGERGKEKAREARRERRSGRRARGDRERAGDSNGLFLGYRLGGEHLLPNRGGRVYLPLHRLEHHLLVAGATGSGKTETVLRVAYSLAAASDWTIVYLDGKGDPQTKERFAALMGQAGRQVALFPDHAYDGWRGSAEEIANRLLQLIDFADEGGGAYYRDLAVSAVHLACQTPNGPPQSSNELLHRLSPAALAQLHAGRPEAAQAAGFRRDDLNAIRARYAAFFTTVGPVLDGQQNLEQTDSAYFLLDGLRLKYEAGYLARFLVEEFTQWAVARKPRQQRVLLIVDEFSAIAHAAHGLVDIVERARGFGVAAALCPQVADGMGGPEATARIIGSTQTILLHTTGIPSQLADIAGTRRVYEYSQQLDRDNLTGLGSARLQHAYRVDLDEVRRLKVGQCFAISPGRAMKLQIAPTPTLENLHQPNPPQPTQR